MAATTVFIAVLATVLINISTGFNSNNVISRNRGVRLQTMMSDKKLPKALLDSSTLWRISLTLSKPGCASIDAIARLRFIEDRNFEPPQGRIFVEDDFNGLIRVDEKGYAGSWTLSEDKDDRKDGLWIWGLFAEPKYPFLYFSLGIFKSIMLPSGLEKPIWDGEGVPNDRLNIRFAHERDPVKGAVLTDAVMEYQITELRKADPFGVGGTINVGDKFTAGTVSLRQVLGDAVDKQDEEALAKMLQGIEGGAAQA
mmetsp:Transcript_36301/g.34308  ORF Transcript_36301/g.34308 Transcript_36301/m.34308 type:complete len:254 (-) Transcript_36301:88-849(-)|eukprot:CAMPEP_0119051324 /NCGR_PEP_ID=MMETSP1177-20130426/72982_1 /TAXON_ID=2985 /ORGANISM="Ochromonas sp, Strain CCMP1899" /LENGTH=253 /DNA_ID=CAMNT_0007030493 /DNA_START=58 /DNA_END=819 /DNA_ORIENTATION=-